MLESGGKYAWDSSDLLYSDNDELPRDVNEAIILLDEAAKLKNENDDYAAQLIAHGWKNSIHTAYVRERPNLVYESVEENVDFDYSDTIWHSIGDKFEAELYQQVVNDMDSFVESLAYNSLDTIQSELRNVDSKDSTDQLPSPSHMTAQINSGKTEFFDSPDFSHNVGNWLGFWMADHYGIEAEDLTGMNQQLNRLAQRANDLSAEVGRHESGELEDFQRGVDFLLKDEGFI
jgi:hypothetical protein